MTLSILKKLFSGKPKKAPFTIVEITVPLGIKEVAKHHPILHTVAGNRALGEIRKFIFVKQNILREGQAMIINEKHGVTCTWVHLGDDYFKLVMKA
jgi:hypothetical protein